ncbi:MAG: methyltransferase [Candidatus Thorarchaeota archaeon]
MKNYHLFDERREGLVRFLVPRKDNKPQNVPLCPKKTDLVFFNPLAQFSRDFSILFLQALAERLGRELSVCDLLTGTGVRSIRYLREVPVSSALLNDKNPFAAQLARKNLAINHSSEKGTVVNEDAFSLIQAKIGKEWFDFVDIDPFGSPQRYYFAGLLVNREGAIALSATDIPTLIGIYPETALRRYGITHSFRSEFEKETAIRALIASFQLRMLSFNRIFVPSLSICLNHYIRVFFCRSRNKMEIKKKIGFIGYCAICDERWTFPVGSNYQECVAEHAHPIQLGGPLWLGPLHSSQTVGKLSNLLTALPWKTSQHEKLLAIIMGEANDFPPWFFDTHKQAQRRKGSPGPIGRVISRLHDKGYSAERTHLSLTGIKTTATGPEIEL